MVLEDYTTFTKEDPGEDITLATNIITLANVNEDDGTYVYKDYTADHFNGDFIIDFDIKFTAIHGDTWSGILCLANVATGEPNFGATAIEVYIFEQDTLEYTIYLYDHNWDKSVNSDVIDVGTQYYLRLTRFDKTYTLCIYTDEARTTLAVPAISITEAAATAFRYLYPFTTGDGSASAYLTGLLVNLDLHEVSDTLFERYNTGAYWDTVKGVNWIAQNFTIGATGDNVTHDVTSVKLKLYRVNSPGLITVSIREVDESSIPKDDDLTVGTLDGNGLTTSTSGAWYKIPLTAYELSADTEYTIVIRAPDGDASNTLKVRFDGDEPPYAGGYSHYSSNSGDDWIVDETYKYLFEEYGLLISGAYMQPKKYW